MTGYDPQLLVTFLAVEQTGSFTRAAARLGLQQPTVSQHIRLVEERVGRTLVLRDTHSVSLTPRRRGWDRVRAQHPRRQRTGHGLFQRLPAAGADSASASPTTWRSPGCRRSCATSAWTTRSSISISTSTRAARCTSAWRSTSSMCSSANGRAASSAASSSSASASSGSAPAVDEGRPVERPAAFRHPASEHLADRQLPRAEPAPAGCSDSACVCRGVNGLIVGGRRRHSASRPSPPALSRPEQSATPRPPHTGCPNSARSTWPC